MLGMRCSDHCFAVSKTAASWLNGVGRFETIRYSNVESPIRYSKASRLHKADIYHEFLVVDSRTALKVDRFRSCT